MRTQRHLPVQRAAGLAAAIVRLRRRLQALLDLTWSAAPPQVHSQVERIGRGPDAAGQGVHRRGGVRGQLAHLRRRSELRRRAAATFTRTAATPGLLRSSSLRHAGAGRRERAAAPAVRRLAARRRSRALAGKGLGGVQHHIGPRQLGYASQYAGQSSRGAVH